jgi:hypothetical protein
MDRGPLGDAGGAEDADGEIAARHNPWSSATTSAEGLPPRSHEPGTALPPRAMRWLAGPRRGPASGPGADPHIIEVSGRLLLLLVNSPIVGGHSHGRREEMHTRQQRARMAP